MMTIARLTICHLFNDSWHHCIDQRAFGTAQVYSIVECSLNKSNRILTIAIFRSDMDEVQSMPQMVFPSKRPNPSESPKLTYF